MRDQCLPDMRLSSIAIANRYDWVRKLISCFVCAIVLLTTHTYAQTNNPGSRIYFPELYGLSTANNTNDAHINSGFLFSSAVEYRFYKSNWFVRFNYDDLNNRYKAIGVTNYSNIIDGKISNNFLLLGAGYRITQKKMAWYTVCQPGLVISGYNTAEQIGQGISLIEKSKTVPGLKLALGAEYYLFNGFAINAETAYYNIFSETGFDHSRFHPISFSLGITTTLF